MSESADPKIESAKPRASYNTIGGINGPLVVLDGVRTPGTAPTPAIGRVANGSAVP